MSDIQFSDFMGEPRRKIVTLTSSNASVPIPDWAQGGKGIVYVTGCGGGGSGSVKSSLGQVGMGGGGGAVANKHPIPIPTATSTLTVVIGAGATGVISTIDSYGNSGGDTTITVGALTLTLMGGNARRPNSSYGGMPYFGTVYYDGNGYIGGLSIGPNEMYLCATLLMGHQGGNPTVSGSYGAGAHGPFGAGGTGRTDAPNGASDGDDATGYGAGGSGASAGGSFTVTSGAGSPGIVILEFVEGF